MFNKPQACSQFQEWIVDCEYNKHWDKIKTLDLPNYKVDWDDTEAKSVFPDIIVHIMGGDGPNLLVIEVKKSSNRSNRTHDYNKLKEYGEILLYSCSLFLEIGTKDSAGAWTPDWIKRENFAG